MLCHRDLSKSSSVCNRTRQDEETLGNFSWVERSVWTERMLLTLGNGVKGGVWFSLIDKVYKRENLYAAAYKVIANKGGAGIDHTSVQAFEANLEEEINKLFNSLREEGYKPSPIKRVLIDKAGSTEKRPLGIPTVRDRVVQTALRNVIEPIFEEGFSEQSFGFRPERSCRDALREVDRELKSGKYWVVDADIRKYFEMIDHRKLMEIIKEKISDSKVLNLLTMFLEQDVLGEMENKNKTIGTPQGGAISPLLANIYLNALDHQMAEKERTMIRYADDSVILCESEEEANTALSEMKEWVEERGLTLHPEKTKVVDMREISQGFDFLGYRFQRTKRNKLGRWVSKKSMKSLRTKLKPILRRTNGKSLEAIISILNPILKGWFGYY